MITSKRRLKPAFNLSTGLGAVLSGRSHGKGVPSSLQGAQSTAVRGLLCPWGYSYSTLSLPAVF